MTARDKIRTLKVTLTVAKGFFFLFKKGDLIVRQSPKEPSKEAIVIPSSLICCSAPTAQQEERGISKRINPQSIRYSD